MTEDDVAKYLEDKGIPSHYSKVFKGTASKCVACNTVSSNV